MVLLILRNIVSRATMALELGISIFGDSWMKNGPSQTYPLQVAAEVGAIPHNFAEIDSKTDALPMQVDRFLKRPKCSRPDEDAVMVAIIHSGGNDLLHNFEKAMTEPMDDVAAQICQKMKAAVAALYEGGVKHFITCDVPFSVVVPDIKEMIEHYARDKNCTFEKAKADAIEREQTLNQAIASMAQKLPEEFLGIKNFHFPEINEIQKWSCEEELFDSDRLHPSDGGHAKLQKAVLALWEDAGFPKGSSKASSSDGAKRPPKRPFADTVSDQPIEQQFKAILDAESLSDLTTTEMLGLYGLFKQVTCGDNETVEPSKLFYKAQKKWAAWMAQKGKSKNQAMAEYVAMYHAIGAKRSRSS